MQAPISVGYDDPAARCAGEVLPWGIQGTGLLLPMKWSEPDGRAARTGRALSRCSMSLGLTSSKHRWEHAQRLIHDNGVSHNVYGDPQGFDRPGISIACRCSSAGAMG